VARRRGSVRHGEERLTTPLDDLVRERGPLTVAAFMEHALYDPESGYYARAAQRSGRAGDFFTSVDVGPVFGELLARQVVEKARLLEPSVSRPLSPVPGRRSPAADRQPPFDLVEAGAGNGRLSADVLRAVRRTDPALYARLRLHLVETSPSARAAQRETLGEQADRLASSSPDLPPSFSGVLLANELLDALPTHQVVMREDGLREVYVGTERLATGDCRLVTIEGPPSTPVLAAYLQGLGVGLEPGWRVEINLRAVDWVREAARRLRHGFLILIDYGHPARELYSVTHAGGTLTTFARHTMSGPERPGAGPAWLERPGGQDITAHVDFTSVERAATAEGASALGLLDQTYFLLGLGAGEMDGADLKTRLALKTLLLPGGLGSTLKVLILGKNVGTPALRGCSFRVRVT
jgi:SAM-dependent MidA family methyltransferase